MNVLEIKSPTVLEVTTAAEKLILAETGSISAPEGKHVTLTVDGVQKNLTAGTYEGNVVLTVTDGFGRTGGFGPPGPAPTNFTAAVRAENGAIVPTKSVLAAISGGTVRDGIMEDAAIVSQGNVFGGIDLMDGEFSLKNVRVKMDGYGGNDFSGQGAALAVSGKAKVDVDGLDIENSGVIRMGVLATDEAEVHVKNARIVTMGGDEKQYREADADVGGMLCVPWQLGLSGNCRATSALGRATVEYDGCKIESFGWGALSVDGTTPSESWDEYSIHLTARNSEVNILGKSGYGAFSIGPSLDVFENTVFHVPDYSLIQANETASAEYTGCTIHSERFGTMSFANQGGHISVKDSAFHTGSAAFLIKGCYPQITVESSRLESGDGTILQMIDCDDPNYGLTGKNLDAQTPEKIESHDVTRVNYHDFYLYNKLLCENKPTDAQVTFKDMELKGNFYNAISNTCPVGTYNPNPVPMQLPPEQLEKMIEKGEIAPPKPDEMPNFTKNPSTAYPANLAVYFENVQYEGILTAAVARHNIKTSGKEHYAQLGVVTNTPCPVVNNGVIVSLDRRSGWTVTGTGYISALHIAEGAKIAGKDGRAVRLTVNGVETPLKPGDYAGQITVSLA